MMSSTRLGLDRNLARLETRAAWVAWARAAAAPFVVLEVAIERGNYPSGDEPLAWALAAVLPAGAAALLLARRGGWETAAGLAFDLLVVSAFVALYSFEAGTIARQLVLVPVLEGAFLYGLAAGALLPLATLPALGFFEWRQAERLDLHPFDAGHVVGPAAISLLVGVAVGALVARLGRERS